MDKTIAILFLEFRDLVSQQIVDLSSTLMRHDFEIRNQRDELNFLKKQIDHLSRQDFDIDSLITWLIQDIEKEVDGPKEIIELLKKIKSECGSSFEELGGS
jgi:chromosome segregation ATPase